MMSSIAMMSSVVNTRREYNWVLSIYVPIGIGVFALFTLAIVGAAILYRRRPSDAPPGTERPGVKSEANLLEASYAVLLTCVVALLLYVTFTAEHREDTAMASERPALTVDITASRWLWRFSYPGHRISRTSGFGARQILVVPAGEPVRFNMQSADVIHSFWVPQLAFKRDAIPGSTERLTLLFDRPGTFTGSCAEYCGTYHAEMVFTVRVLSRTGFRHWLAGGGRTPA